MRLVDDGIVLEKINSSYYKLHAPSWLRDELVEEFSFEKPNSFHLKKALRQKGIRWDGKIRLYTSKRSWLPIGLEDQLREAVKDRKIPIRVTYNPKTMPVEAPDSSQDAVEAFLKKTRVKVQGKLYPLRKAQFLALWFALQANRKVIVSPTASRKKLDYL